MTSSVGSHASAEESASVAPGTSRTIARSRSGNAAGSRADGERAPAQQRGAPVGRVGLEAVERGACALEVVLEEARLGAAERDVLVLAIGEPLEPELGARAVAVRQIEVGEPQERLASRVAAGLGDGERAQERVARLLRRRADALARAAEAHPDLAA